MNKLTSLVVQTVFYSVIGLAVIYFADSPPYRYFPDDQALIKMSFKHTGQRVESCKRIRSDEIAKLPPGERKPTKCERGRNLLVVEVLVDGEFVYRETLTASGLFSDGPAKVYLTEAVSLGAHEITVRMNDSGRPDGFDFEKTAVINLQPREILVIDFAPEYGGFIFK